MWKKGAAAIFLAAVFPLIAAALTARAETDAPNQNPVWLMRLRAHGNTVVVNRDADGEVISLEINGGGVHEVDLTNMAGLKRLERLHLGELQRFDGIERLENLKSLRLLSLYMVPMKGQKLDVLTRMPRLDQLALNTPELDVEDLRLVLSKLPQLKTLGLAFDDLEARHLEPLKGAQDLYRLDVRLCKGINDEIIPLLLSFPRLHTVFLDWTSVTSDGMDRLRAARPDLDINVEMGK